jgi:hypothetical protein
MGEGGSAVLPSFLISVSSCCWNYCQKLWLSDVHVPLPTVIRLMEGPGEGPRGGPGQLGLG